MFIYPKELLAKNSYPILDGDDVLSFFLVRETTENLYKSDQDNNDDFIRKIIAPQKHPQEVFELSVILFGYYCDKHIGIRANDFENWNHSMENLQYGKIGFSYKALFPLFLKAIALFNKKATYKNSIYRMSFSHCPTRTNYWHFQLWVEDPQGKRLKRNSKSIETCMLAELILSEYVRKAISSPSVVIKFKRSDFDTKLKTTLLSVINTIENYFLRLYSILIVFIKEYL
jgi:hypothetical protein